MLPPPKKIVTKEISGIDVLQMEDAAVTLWKNQIYAETGMGLCRTCHTCGRRRFNQSDGNFESGRIYLNKAVSSYIYIFILLQPQNDFGAVF